MTEKILSSDRRLTIVGQASDVDGQLAIRKGGPQFVVSTASREDLVQSARTQALALGLVGTGLLLAGAAMAVLGVVRR